MCTIHISLVPLVSLFYRNNGENTTFFEKKIHNPRRFLKIPMLAIWVAFLLLDKDFALLERGSRVLFQARRSEAGAFSGN